jgi:hypothetical protein
MGEKDGLRPLEVGVEGHLGSHVSFRQIDEYCGESLYEFENLFYLAS